MDAVVTADPVVTSAPAVRIRNLTKSHGGPPVLNGVGLDLFPGEILGLVGENGVGKSTFMRILAGEYPADSGEMVIDGEVYQPRNPADAKEFGVGMIHQAIRLDPKLTVAEAIFRGSPQYRRSPEEMHRRAEHALRVLGTQLSPDRRIAELHPAEQAFVEAARLSVEKARLVIMDEVTATANAGELATMHRIARIFAGQGRSIIYISHRLTELHELSDRIAVMIGGEIDVIFDADQVTPDHIADAMLPDGYATPEHDRAGHPTDQPLLEVRNLTVGDKLAGVDFTVHRGEVLGFVGPRRSGVREVALALSGTAEGATLQARWNGRDEVRLASAADADRLGIAYFSDQRHEDGVDAERTVAQHLAQTGHPETPEQVAERLRLQEEHLYAEVAILSEGQRQKLALQRWVGEQRELVILNEPTRGLDVASRREIYAMLAEHTERGHAAILFTSDPTELLDWCDTIAMIRAGRLTGIEPAADLDDLEITRAMSARAI